MKKLLGVLLFFLVGGFAFAQTATDTDKYVELMRADVRAQKVQILTKAMEFSVEESAAFWPVYDKYQQEFNKLGDQKVALIKDYAANFENLEDSKARELAERALGLEEMRVSLLKKYYPEFGKVLSGKKVARFLQVENQINRLIDLQIASGIPLVQ